ncbi:MAG: AAA family ATPase [Psychrosphaera sp.]|nr:AAA family ATPase [Psychrosphaera sp.]
MVFNHVKSGCCDLCVNDFRTFQNAGIGFVDKDLGIKTKLQFPNINVVLGNNGLGKTTLLKAISLACLGPAISDSGIYPYRLIRTCAEHETSNPASVAQVAAEFTCHKQDGAKSQSKLHAGLQFIKCGDLESLRSTIKDESP